MSCAEELYLKALEAGRSEAPRSIVAELLEEAFSLGSPQAALAIANWIHHRIHYAEDARRELDLIVYAVNHDIPEALYCLAVKYETGVKSVLRKSESKAFYYYMKAALLGDPDSYLEVSRCYHWGIGTARNRSLAGLWRAIGKEKGGRFVSRG